MNQSPPSGLTPVFRSTDPLEASAVADALQSAGISATLIEDPGAVPPGSVPFAATVIGSIPGLGSRPTLVLVPSSLRRAAIDVAQAFRPRHRSSSRNSAQRFGPVEGVGLQPTRSHRLLAWTILITTVTTLVVAAVQAVLQLLR